MRAEAGPFSLPAILQGERRTWGELIGEWVRSRSLGNSWGALGLVALVAAMLGLGQVIEPGTMRLLSAVFMFVALAQGWNIIGGFTGYASFTVLMVIMVVIGGSGSVIGPLVGAAGLELLSQYLRINLGPYNQLIFGAIVVVVVVFFPQGVVTFFRDAWRTRRLSFLDNIRRYRL